MEEAAATGAGVIASACPYCLTMLWDGTKDMDLEAHLAVKDIAELVEEALE